ncbi:hypothetical protein [Paenibacillus turpanensis]|uniref:hypothetical protein n=1 Tax=Paenibacillus turpanensis TaxID=2689078 RepID=UPI00140AC582|nr:hypothetical protein [Paenibacillus turpanensis]
MKMVACSFVAAVFMLQTAAGGAGAAGADRVMAGTASKAAAPASAAASSVIAAKPRPWIDHYMIHYGQLNDQVIALAQSYQLVILHPQHANLTREQVKRIQQGKNAADPKDDVLVLAYVSVGEDVRTYGLTAEQMRKDPRFIGDASGPRVDPRGPKPGGSTSLDGIEPSGKPSPGGTGFASWYLDDNDRDGLPDRNTYFDVAFVNIGDPKWFDELNAMKTDVDGAAGFGEILTDTYGRALGCDGVFLDTVDTTAPNSYTDENSPNQSEFEWTAPGYLSFVEKLRGAYPNKLILQNRGLFYFDPRLPHYQYNAGRYIDFVLFESYRLNSSAFETFNVNFALDNKYSAMPKLMAEANRPNGFQVLSLGYAEGPAGQINADTLLRKSEVGEKLLRQDIHEAQNIAGFRHYITNQAITLTNDFVLKEGSLKDETAPAWSSTYNDSPAWPPKTVTPRIGIQKAAAYPQGVKVSWDVALDLHPVRYTLYYQDKPFDFAQDPELSKASRLELPLGMGEGYRSGVGPAVYPYEATIRGLQPGVTYYMLIRASDRSKNANEEKNQQWIAVTPLS